MKNIKLFETPVAANNFSIIDIPFVAEIESTGQVVTCDESGKKLVNNGGTIDVENVGPTIEMVDLGLPSGRLWAKTNIGAQSETEAGLYFAWGETAQHEGWLADKSTHPYDWNEYIYAESDYKELTKYCNNSEYGYQGFTDGKTVLEATDDVVTVVLGAGYKMPTKAQFEELKAGTNKEWTTINGVSGYKFTNKSDSSKYIFLPAAGRCTGSNLSNVGNRGYYWSSSLNAGAPNHAWCVFLNSDGEVNMYDYNRCIGYSVRPVC